MPRCSARAALVVLLMAAAAMAFDFPIIDVHVHLAGAVENCLTVEYFLLEEDIYNFEKLLAERLRPKDGYITIPNRPGVGLVLDEAAVARYRIG